MSGHLYIPALPASNFRLSLRHHISTAKFRSVSVLCIIFYCVSVTLTNFRTLQYVPSQILGVGTHCKVSCEVWSVAFRLRHARVTSQWNWCCGGKCRRFNPLLGPVERFIVHFAPTQMAVYYRDMPSHSVIRWPVYIISSVLPDWSLHLS